MLRITKESIFSEQFLFEDIEMHDILEDGCFINHLSEEVQIDANVTLKDLLNMLEIVQDEVDIVFGSSLGGNTIEPFLDEVNSKSVKDNNYSVECLKFGRICELITYQSGETELIEDFDFYGYGVDLETKTPKEYVLEFAPLNFYGNVPIILDNSYEIWQNVPTNTYIKEINGSVRPVFNKILVLKTNKVFTLYDFLDTILFEISKYGTPEERNQTKVNIFGTDVVAPDKDNVNSEDNLLSHIKELEKLEKEAVQKEDYEKSATYRDKITEIKEKLKKKDGN